VIRENMQTRALQQLCKERRGPPAGRTLATIIQATRREGCEKGRFATPALSEHTS